MTHRNKPHVNTPPYVFITSQTRPLTPPTLSAPSPIAALPIRLEEESSSCSTTISQSRRRCWAWSCLGEGEGDGGEGRGRGQRGEGREWGAWSCLGRPQQTPPPPPRGSSELLMSPSPCLHEEQGRITLRWVQCGGVH